ncbi:MAG: preprotein translocase subunit SecE [Oscillospiraceae bacterium]
MAEKERSKWHPVSIWNRIKKFFRDQQSEVKKIVWSSKKQVINNTGVVLVAVLITSVVVGGFDAILAALVNLLLG